MQRLVRWTAIVVPGLMVLTIVADILFHISGWNSKFVTGVGFGLAALIDLVVALIYSRFIRDESTMSDLVDRGPHEADSYN